MAEIQTIEGTHEELQEKLQSFPKEQRFRLIPLPQSALKVAEEKEEYRVLVPPDYTPQERMDFHEHGTGKEEQ